MSHPTNAPPHTLAKRIQLEIQRATGQSALVHSVDAATFDDDVLDALDAAKCGAYGPLVNVPTNLADAARPIALDLALVLRSKNAPAGVVETVRGLVSWWRANGHALGDRHWAFVLEQRFAWITGEALPSMQRIEALSPEELGECCDDAAEALREYFGNAPPPWFANVQLRRPNAVAALERALARRRGPRPSAYALTRAVSQAWSAPSLPEKKAHARRSRSK